MINLQLNTTLEVFEKLHELSESQAKKISIDPEVLRLLLLDHSIMFRALSDNKATYKIREPRVRAKI